MKTKKEIPYYKRPGRCSVYLCHATGFDGHLRPCYDSAPAAYGQMTSEQVSTLTAMIARYVKKCNAKNQPQQEASDGKEKAEVRRG